MLPWVMVVCILVVCFSSPAMAEQKAKHGISGGFGWIGGSGLGYIHYLGPNMLQLSFAGNVDEFRSDYTIGVSFARYLHHVRDPRSMVPVALKLIVGTDVRYQSGIINSGLIVTPDTDYNTLQSAYFITTGAGLGIDIGSPGEPGLVWSLAISYALSIEDVSPQKREWLISPLPAMALIYSW